MKRIVLTLSLLVFSVSAFCQLKYTLDLKGLAQINFPDTPEVNNPTPEVVVFIARSDAPGYMAAVSPARVSVKEMLAGEGLESIYSGCIEGSLNVSKGKLLYRKNVLIDQLKAVEFAYKAVGTRNTFYAYNRVLFLNDTLLVYSLISYTPLKQGDENIRKFFSTFKLKLKPENIRQNTSTELAYKMGTISGKAAATSLMLLAVVCVILLIKKLFFRRAEKHWDEDGFKE